MEKYFCKSMNFHKIKIKNNFNYNRDYYKAVDTYTHIRMYIYSRYYNILTTCHSIVKIQESQQIWSHEWTRITFTLTFIHAHRYTHIDADTDKKLTEYNATNSSDNWKVLVLYWVWNSVCSMSRTKNPYRKKGVNP